VISKTHVSRLFDNAPAHSLLIEPPDLVAAFDGLEVISDAIEGAVVTFQPLDAQGRLPKVRLVPRATGCAQPA